MSSSNRLIVAILLVAALAIGFWMVLLSPKREEADKLGAEVEGLELTLSEAQSRLTMAEDAKREFPADYRQLVVLGQAVPEGEETSSLLVELSQVSKGTELKFSRFELNSSGEAVPPPAPTPPATPPPSEGTEGSAVPAAATVPPTEAAASILPLGATIGSAGLGVMPYTLAFSGNFFQVTDFISRIDSLVKTHGANVAVDGRLITLDGFALSADGERGFPYLDASFAVTTYVTPPTEGLTAGATPTEPVPTSTTPEGEEAQ
jgi:Tfp pilus assembly protein PilO